MALRKRGAYRFGDGPDDLHVEIKRYSLLVGYQAEHFSDCVCACSNRLFKLALDEAQGAAVRQCIVCNAEHPIADSEEFLADATLEETECPWGKNGVELSLGVSLYENSEAVRWLYVGCRCSQCGLVAVYGDWKNEFENFRVLLAKA